MNYKHIFLVIAPILFFACHKSKDEPEPEPEVDAQMSIGTFSDNWTCSVIKGKTSNFDIAEFTLWVPNAADVSNLKAILVLAHHSNSNALGLVFKKEWQDFAKTNNVALLAVHLENLNPQISLDDTYSDARKGSGDALLMALEAISRRNNIATVAALPFLFRGYSAGGMFSFNFSVFKPERVIAFADVRGWYINPTTDINNGVPGLFLIAELDTEKYDNVIPAQRMKEIVQSKRKQNALWGYAVEPGEDHFGSLTKSDSLLRLFLASALKSRVQSGSNVLHSITQASGWLGNNDSKVIFSYDTYPQTKNEASWLIDEAFANEWIAYQK
jgi:hypothetical protein